MEPNSDLAQLSLANLDEIDIHSSGFSQNPYPYYALLRERMPLMHSPLYGGFWMLTRYEDVRQAALDWRTYTSSVVGVTAIPVITPRTEPMLPIEVDPPLHSRYRALMSPVFSGERIQALRPLVEEIAGSLIDNLLKQGGGDLVADYCVPLSVQTLAAFSGLPAEDTPLWVGWIWKMFDVQHPQERDTAAREFGAYIDRMIAERIQHPRGDFLSLLAGAQVDGHRLSEKDLHSFSTVLFGAGFETTSDALSVTLHHLAIHADDRRRLAEQTDLIPSAVEEFLRFGSPIQIFGRNTTRAVELHGRVIPKGDVVALAFGSANHDPGVFSDPERIILERAPNRHMAFGSGPHLCLGAPVARLELAVTLQEFLKRIPDFWLPAGGEILWKKRGDRRGIAALPCVVKKN